MNFNLLPLSAVMAAALVAGCAATVPLPKAEPDPTAVALDAALSNVKTLPAHTASADAKAPEAKMQGIISISYVGEGKELLKRVAVSRGLKFIVRGPEPRLPLFVVVDQKDASFEDFLSDVGAQFGQRANLVLTDTAIEVRYRD